MFKKLFVMFLLVVMATSVMAENLPPPASESGLPTPPSPDSSTSLNDDSTSEATSDGSSGSGGGSGGSSGGSGSSGSGSSQVSACVSDWICEPWSECNLDLQTRRCFDTLGCSVPTNEPSSERSCEEGVEAVVPTPVVPDETLPLDEEENSSSVLLTLGVLAVTLIIVLLGIIAFLYYRKPTIRKGPEFNRLVDFVHKNQHLEPEVINTYAKQSGWKPAEVEEARNRVNNNHDVI